MIRRLSCLDFWLIFYIAVALLLTTCVVSGLLDSVDRSMRQILVIAGLAALGWYVLDYVSIRRLPDIGEEAFLDKLGDAGEYSEEVLLKARQLLADALMVPAEKLDPKLKVSELGSSFGLFMKTTDIDLELIEAFSSVGLKPPKVFPETIGGLVFEFARVAKLREAKREESGVS